MRQVKTISKQDLVAGIISLNMYLPDVDLERMCKLAGCSPAQSHKSCIQE